LPLRLNRKALGNFTFVASSDGKAVSGCPENALGEKSAGRLAQRNGYRARAPTPDHADAPRPGKVAVDLPARFDASLYFIGRNHTHL
jgi:hypothetical protein